MHQKSNAQRLRKENGCMGVHKATEKGESTEGKDEYLTSNLKNNNRY